MNLIEKYQSLSEAHRWEDALVVVREIIERAPHINTSWFNLGVCLDELERYVEAGDAFHRAYELDPEDYGAQYRMFLSFHQGEAHDRFLELLRHECDRDAGMIDHFLEDEDFGPLFERPEFRALASRYSA